MTIRCRCTSTCQFRGNVAEKGEIRLLEDSELENAFIREHFVPVDGQVDPGKVVQAATKAPQKRGASKPVAVSADDLPFMKEGR